MKIIKPFLLAIFSLAMLFSSINTTDVYAEGKDIEPTKSITVEVNAQDALLTIKTDIIEDYLKTHNEFTMEDIDIEKSEITMQNADLTSVSKHSVAVLINLQPKNEMSQPLIKKSISTNIILNVQDTIKPGIEIIKDEITIKIDSEFNPWEYVEYVYDNSAKDMWKRLVVDSNVDTSAEGEYNVNYSLTDDSGNNTQKDMKVTVSSTALPSIDLSNLVTSGDEITDMLNMINAFRAENGLTPFQLADELGQQAVALRAQEAAGYLSHTRPDGRHYKTAFEDVGAEIPVWPLENLTYAGSTVQDKFNWWLSSSGHRAVLLSDDSFTTIAIGYSGQMWCVIVYK